MPQHALVYFYPQGHSAHFEAGHPERPERVEAIRQALEQAGCWESYPHLPALVIPTEVLTAIHTPRYVQQLKEACRNAWRLDGDTYTTTASWELALQAAGGAAAVATVVWQGQARHGFALTRPPGHHATPNRGMGFCLLNNASLAAEYLLQIEGAKKLAIVDLDLHHGNGTQEIFWSREDVLYISTHQSPLYPGTGSLEEIGAGPGRGLTVNLPLPPGSGDDAFRAVMDGVILPLLDRYGPEMLLVSVGFDTHWRDPLGSLQLSAGVFGELIASLARWAGKHCSERIALILEGGYDLQAAAANSLAGVAALTGRPFQDPLGPAPFPESPGWENLVRRAQSLWSL